ncbi:MAG TPA: hypothetical protein VHC20_05455 [Candidatus Paceibacterota bacterium]|nr:hypothetical protein [Candidatus Paceibacterota bacterium]
MNTANVMTEVRSALAHIAESYEPSRRVRFKNLVPFKDEIRDLRSRGAAFATIAQILRKHSVKASHETVRRFYREHIEGKPRRRKRSRNGSRLRLQPAQPRRSEIINGNASRSTARPERGPRIARIEDL